MKLFRERVYISLVIASGLILLVAQASQWRSADLTRFLCYLVIASVASALKVRLPGITGTMSVNFLFILIGVVELSLPETLALGTSAVLVQCFWHAKKKPGAIQVLFNLSAMSVAIFSCYLTYHSALLRGIAASLPLLLALSACVYFLVNTVPIAMVIALTEGKPMVRTWKECYFWSFPYYLVGASISWIVSVSNRYAGWHATILTLPVIFFLYRTYRMYLDRLEAEKSHVEQMAALHLRTIQALALAIDAKDQTTHDHLQRVQVYAIELGKDLGLSETEREALRTASLLHDIGKLAVPEHILSKPGKLTPEEFEKIKIHPVVGAGILERVKFPYPVVPIVRSHHEKWDGTGYPDGLTGEEIPIGARILSVVDCLDALASDRQYRRALPLDEAMEKVASMAGNAFDPRVIAALQSRYRELEALAKSQQPPEQFSLNASEVRVERGEAPDAGFAKETARAAAGVPAEDPISSIAAARQEAQALFELTRDLGSSLSLSETLSLVAARLGHLVPYDAVAIYIIREGRLVPEFVTGEDSRLLSGLRIPLGEGLSGWIAENKKPIVNGNPSVEPGYLADPSKFSILCSALAVPLEGVGAVVGVLALYSTERDAFSKDHLRVLLAISSKLALAVENALRYRQAEDTAVTDYLTGLPNARSLFLHLEGEIERSRRAGAPLALLVCDLDGFKQVNDVYGHLEGNRMLQAVAQGLQSNCRGYDYVARMGGDEFVVLLPGAHAGVVGPRLAEFRQVAVNAGLALAGQRILSMSVGAAFFPEDGTDAEQLLALADRRMYKAKAAQEAVGPAQPAWQSASEALARLRERTAAEAVPGHAGLEVPRR